MVFSFFFHLLGLYECKPCEEHENPQDLNERRFKPQLPVGYREKFIEKDLKEKEEKQKYGYILINKFIMKIFRFNLNLFIQ